MTVSRLVLALRSFLLDFALDPVWKSRNLGEVLLRLISVDLVSVEVRILGDNFSLYGRVRCLDFVLEVLDVVTVVFC